MSKEGKDGFRPIARRQLTPEEQKIRREWLLENTPRAIYEAARPLRRGVYTSVELTPHVQQFADSCGIACALAIRSGIGRARNLLTPVIKEEDLLREAEARGIYRPGGIYYGEETARFLREKVGIEVGYRDLEPPELGRMCVEEIKDGNLLILAQPGHFTVLYGFDKLSDQDVQWLMMDPLRKDLQRISTINLSERIIGSRLQPGGIAGNVLPVNVERSTLLSHQIPKFTSIKKFQPH